MKKKIKKIIFSIILIILVLVFLYLKNRSINYEEEYKVNEFKIKETYNKKENTYIFYVDYKDKTYTFRVINDYVKKHILIDEIAIYKENNEICLHPKIDEFNLYPLCNEEEEFISYNLSKVKVDDFQYQEIKENKKEYDKITINSSLNNNYLIYNYKGFYYINNEEIKEIKFFKEDNYNLDLVYQYENYLLVANYNQDYYFNSFYVIDMEDGKSEIITFDYEISFNSVFLGNYKKDIYLLDKKNKIEYKINIKKGKVEETDYVILENDELVKKTYNEIIKNNLGFNKDKQSYYSIIDNKLYEKIDNYKIRISDSEIDKLIKEDNDTVYYLSKEKLYMYNSYYGEIMLMSNLEWNFNNKNIIFIY